MKRLISRSYCILMAVCMSITSGVILAQSPAAVTQAGTETKWVTCDKGAALPGAFSHCALRIDQNWLKRGDDKEIIAKRRLFRPLPIVINVVGDSAATDFARRYRRAELWRGWLVGLGATLIASSFATSRICKTHSCQYGESASTLRYATYTGVGLLAVSIPFRIHAYKLGHRAVDLYNASLNR